MAISKWRLPRSFDRQIFATAAYRIWTVFAGGCTIVLIPFFLSKGDQGYYFTFLSLLALQIFFELGLSQVLIQVVASKSASLESASWIALKGKSEDVYAIQSLARLTSKWYSIAAVIFFLFVGVCGALYLSIQLEVPTMYLVVWLILVACTAWNLILSGKFSILDGLGLVSNVARVRMRQSMLGYVLMWISLIAGIGLYSMTLLPVTAGIYGTIVLVEFKKIFEEKIEQDQSPVSWMRDIFPMQWRVALSWVSGYFMFQIFTPAIFKAQGAEEAGRLGIALTAFSAIQSVGMSWVSAKAPTFSTLITLGQRVALDSLFDKLLQQAILFTGIASAVAIGVATLLDHLGLPVYQRVSSPVVLVLLSMIAIANLVVYCKATYLRSHRNEPMMPVSICSAVITAGLTFALAKYGSEAVLSGYLFVSCCVTLPWTNWIFRGFRRKFNGMDC